MNYAEEFEAIVDTFEKSGGQKNLLKSDKVASLVVAGNKVIFKNVVDGISVKAQEKEDGVKIHLKVEDNVEMAYPIHLCYGVVHKTGRQHIDSTYEIGNNAKVEFLAHCSFPKAVDVQHLMDANITIGKNSVMRYNEVHFHGPEGGIEVTPKAYIKVGPGAKYISEFRLVDGRVGIFDMDYTVDVGAHGVTELSAKLYGKGNDKIKIKETIHLRGEYSKGIAKSRIVNTEHSSSEVLGEIIGHAAHSRGHIDCTEIVEGEFASASAVPLVKVVHPQAKITHEAAIGSVDKLQLETLMARGLNEDEAIDMIVKGLLS